MTKVGDFDASFDVNIIASYCDELTKFNTGIQQQTLSTKEKEQLAQILQQAWKGPETSANFATSEDFSSYVETVYEGLINNHSVVITDKNVQYGDTTVSKVSGQFNLDETRSPSPASSEADAVKTRMSKLKQKLKKVREAIGSSIRRRHEPASKSPKQAILLRRQADDSHKPRESRPFILPQLGPVEYTNWKISDRTSVKHLMRMPSTYRHRTPDVKNYPHAVSVLHASEKISPHTKTLPERTLRIVTGANAGVATPLLDSSHEEGVYTVGITRFDTKTQQPKPASGHTDTIAGDNCLATEVLSPKDHEAHEKKLDAMAQQILDGIPQDATFEEIQVVNNVGFYYFDQELIEVKNQSELDVLLLDPINQKLDTFRPVKEEGQAERPPTIDEVNTRIKANQKKFQATNIVYERNLQRLTEIVCQKLKERNKEGASIRIVPVILGSAQRKDDERSRNKDFSRMKEHCAQSWMNNPSVHCIVQVNTGLINTPGAISQWGASQPHWLSTDEVAHTVIGALDHSHEYTFLEIDTFRPQPSEQLASIAKRELDKRRWSI